MICERPKWHIGACGSAQPEDADALRDKPHYLCPVMLDNGITMWGHVSRADAIRDLILQAGMR